MVFWIDCDAPVPMATTTMTQPTPMMMPSMVSDERILLREMARRPTRVMLPSLVTDFS